MKPNDYINFKTILIKVIKEEEEERKFYFTKKFKSLSANMALFSKLNQYEFILLDQTQNSPYCGWFEKILAKNK